MRTVTGYLIFGAFALVLSSCTHPYYTAQPPPVYYPLQRPGSYYPAQHAGIYYPPPRAGLYPGREPTRESETLRTRQPAEAPTEPRRQTDRHRGIENQSGWINPEP
jgi:hypothetical protein